MEQHLPVQLAVVHLTRTNMGILTNKFMQDIQYFNSAKCSRLQHKTTTIANHETVFGAAQALEDQGEEIEAAQASAVASAAASEDLHASLEGQLRSSHADVSRLQSELKRLKAATETASPVGRDAFQSNLQAKYESQLQASKADAMRLQAEVDHLKAEMSTSAAAAGMGVDSPVSRDGSQEASVSGRSAAESASFSIGTAQGQTHCGLYSLGVLLACCQALG